MAAELDQLVRPPSLAVFRHSKPARKRQQGKFSGVSRSGGAAFEGVPVKEQRPKVTATLQAILHCCCEHVRLIDLPDSMQGSELKVRALHAQCGAQKRASAGQVTHLV